MLVLERDKYARVFDKETHDAAAVVVIEQDASTTRTTAAVGAAVEQGLLDASGQGCIRHAG
jgi:hypothetical protein